MVAHPASGQGVGITATRKSAAMLVAVQSLGVKQTTKTLQFVVFRLRLKGVLDLREGGRHQRVFGFRVGKSVVPIDMRIDLSFVMAHGMAVATACLCEIMIFHPDGRVS